MSANLDKAKDALSQYFQLGFASKDLIEAVAKEFGVNPKELKEEFLETIRKPKA